MAFLMTSGSKVEYTVSDTVGQHCLNRPDDVVLVQYFLTLATKISVHDGGMREYPPIGGPLLVDGQYGPKTHYWSLYYLMYACDDLKDAFNCQAFFMNHLDYKPSPKNRPMARLMRVAEFTLGSKEWAALPDSPRTPLLLRTALKKYGPKAGARPLVKV